MKNISRIVIAMLAFSVSEARAEETEMVPIEEFLKGESSGANGLGDAAQQFVGLRCGSLYLILAQYGKDNGMSDLGEKFSRAAEAALGLARSAKPYSEEYVLTQVAIIMDGYKKRWLKAKAMTGNFSDDRLIKSDIDLCGKIF